MATIFDLLQALNRGDLPPLPPPAPSMPIPLTTAGQPATPQYQFNPIPEMAPQAPAPGLDMGFVNQYAGQAPTAPTLSEPTTIDKIAAVLGGIAYGPGYAQSLREERQRPQREFEAARERYQGRRAQALELAQRKQERQQELTQRRAEQQASRDFEAGMARMKVTDETARDQMRQAFQLELQNRKDREAEEKQQRAIEAATEKERRAIEDELATKDGASPSIAKEISEYRVGKRPALSAAAEKWRGQRFIKLQAETQKLELQKARLAAGGGGSSKNEVDVVDANGNLLKRMPYSQIKFGTYGEMKGFPEGAKIRFAQPQQTQQAPQIPNPVAELGAQVLPTAPQAPVAPKLNNRQRAKFNDIKREQPEFTDEQILTYMQKKGWL